MNRRNMAASEPTIMQMPQATWSDWTVHKSVKDGLKSCGWVYRAISMIAENAAGVPWVVYDKDGQALWDHPISLMLDRPNPQLSRKDVFELLVTWQQLTGMAYLKRVIVGGRTTELWPISPDRIAPIASREPGQLISGYEIVAESGAKINGGEDFSVDNIVQFKLIDPANPILGIGPLAAAARAVDTDVEQQAWNKSAMQNRGVLDGIFSFDRDLDRNTFDTIRKMLKEMFSGSRNARAPGVIGSNAKYQQLSITPAEMDFLNSRKFNREEIFIIFGVPPQLAGVQDSSTYNNYSASMRIFWESTIIPLLDDMKDTFNHVMAKELGGYWIGYDTSNVRALAETEKERAETAKVFFDMGVPMSVLNDKFELGIAEYEGWDQSQLNKPVTSAPEPMRALTLIENRSIDDDVKKKESLSQQAAATFAKLLTKQQARIFSALDNKQDIAATVAEDREDWVNAMTELGIDTAMAFAGTVAKRSSGFEQRMTEAELDDVLYDAISSFFTEQDLVLVSLSLIEQATVNEILAQVQDGIAEGKNMKDIKQAIQDAGLFSPERALRIARTETATAASSGQFVAAAEAGAQYKVWVTSGFEVRDAHVARSGEKVGLYEYFSASGGGLPPFFPGDPRIPAADRINCRCSMTFE
jgi:HK97 family phage portal protein